MFRSTAVLIEARSRHCQPAPKVVPVRRIPMGVHNDCFNNAYSLLKNFSHSKLVSGWLATDYDSSGTADFIQHWWNFLDGEYVDITPLSSRLVCEYVVDMELYEYVYVHYDDLTNLVASSLTLKERQFGIVTHLGGAFGTIAPTEDISCATLYRNSRLQ